MAICVCVSPLSLYPYFFFHPTHTYISCAACCCCWMGIAVCWAAGSCCSCCAYKSTAPEIYGRRPTEKNRGRKKKSFARPFYFSIENELDVESGAPKTVHHPPPTKKKIEIKSKERKKLEGYDLIYVRLFMGCWMAKWKGGGRRPTPQL